MPYEIPQNLKYKEKILFNLTMPQVFWLGLFIGLAGIIFLKMPITIEIKIILAIILILFGAGFAFFDLFSFIQSILVYKKSIKKAGYFDKKLNEFIEVSKIENDCIYLKNNSMKAIIDVLPINFGILSTQEQKAIISGYKEFLHSIDFPIQIVMRTTNLNLDEYLFNLKQEVMLRENKQLLEQFESFKLFTQEFIQENTVKNRLFYIVIPFSNGASANKASEVVTFLKNLFSKNKEKSLKQINKENAENQLSIRIELCKEKLKKSNLLAKRLNSEELTSLLASFFESSIQTQNNYFSQLILLKKFEGENIEQDA
ncbi:MAG: PrgI family protein [archaeon]|nr:PrgI family protein [archaeon]